METYNANDARPHEIATWNPEVKEERDDILSLPFRLQSYVQDSNDLSFVINADKDEYGEDIIPKENIITSRAELCIQNILDGNRSRRLRNIPEGMIPTPTEMDITKMEEEENQEEEEEFGYEAENNESILFGGLEPNDVYRIASRNELIMDEYDLKYTPNLDTETDTDSDKIDDEDASELYIEEEEETEYSDDIIPVLDLSNSSKENENHTSDNEENEEENEDEEEEEEEEAVKRTETEHKADKNAAVGANILETLQNVSPLDNFLKLCEENIITHAI